MNYWLIDIIHAVDGFCNFVAFFSIAAYLYLKIQGYKVVLKTKISKFVLIAAYLGVLLIPSQETLIKLLG